MRGNNYTVEIASPHIYKVFDKTSTYFMPISTLLNF